jgi:hypothetical protein
MLYVYSPRSSNGARDLVESLMLAGVHTRRTKGLALRNVTAAADQVICWGGNAALPNGTPTLNNVAAISKFTEAQKLAEAGVATVQVSRTKPNTAVAAKAPFQNVFKGFTAGNMDVTRATALHRELTQFIQEETARRQAWERQPAQPVETWLPRRNNHMGGSDLLNPNVAEANFWSKKENIVEEYRLHMFRGKSIRAGKKVKQAVRDGRPQTSHDWIRSYDAGWIINYEGFSSTKEMRKLAAKALKALNLDFGAVDIGKKADGTLIVFEVNRAPGIEGNSIAAYVKHIQAWLKNPKAPEAVEE